MRCAVIAVAVLALGGGVARADGGCDADVVRLRYHADAIAGLPDYASVWQRLESDRVALAHACDDLSDDASTMHDATVDVDPGDEYAVARHRALHHGRAASNTLDDADPLLRIVAARVVPPPARPPVAWASRTDFERDCELGDRAACARANAALTDEDRAAWQTRACTKRGVADACFAIGNHARGAKLLDRACRGKRDAAACHRLADFYAGSPKRAKAYVKLERRFADAVR